MEDLSNITNKVYDCFQQAENLLTNLITGKNSGKKSVLDLEKAVMGYESSSKSFKEVYVFVMYNVYSLFSPDASLINVTRKK